MVESNDLAADAKGLVNRLSEDGYLFFRNVLDRDKVLAVRSGLTQALHRLGWFAAPDAASPTPGFSTTIGEAEYWEGLAQILRVPSLHDLTRDPDLVAMIERIYGEPAMRQPRFVPRAVFPWPENEWSEMAAHQDVPYVQGTLDTLTAWIAIGDCASEGGALEVLQGSHRNGMREIFGSGKYRCAATKVDAVDPSWRGADFRAGDLLIFTSLTIHRARRNNSRTVRLTMDVRYQPTNSTMCDQLMEPPFYPNVPDWNDLLEPDELARVRATVGTQTDSFVEPSHYRAPEVGRVFPWLVG
jgi:ectoine hydroxylase-related dioxygenase (phytanoyl-CoA dioxygenase family)